MPRAEIPDGVERYAFVTNRQRHREEIKADPQGSYVAVADLPKLRAHWLEQLKEEQDGRRLRERAAQYRQEATRLELDAKSIEPRHRPDRMTLRASMLRDFAQILEDEAAALDSIPIGVTDDSCARLPRYIPPRTSQKRESALRRDGRTIGGIDERPQG